MFSSTAGSTKFRLTWLGWWQCSVPTPTVSPWPRAACGPHCAATHLGGEASRNPHTSGINLNHRWSWVSVGFQVRQSIRKKETQSLQYSTNPDRSALLRKSKSESLTFLKEKKISMILHDFPSCNILTVTVHTQYPDPQCTRTKFNYPERKNLNRIRKEHFASFLDTELRKKLSHWNQMLFRWSPDTNAYLFI